MTAMSTTPTIRTAIGPAARQASSEAHGVLGLGGLRLTRRGRAVLVALALLVSGAFGLLGTQAVAGGPGEPVEVRVHTVAPGETLWDYASTLAGAGEDVRDVVAYLRSLNDLPTAELQVGQVLLLPAE
jgi:predicted Zn-dependent protease